MLVNILDNAIKYTKEKPIILVSTYNSNNYLYIHVKDNGIGISRKAQKHIFDKFYREETGNIHNTKGHGLGLSYVKRIVHLQHGEISVKSEENQGTTFILKFPLDKKVGLINT
jgi:two-component system phosphate regulon sensor histidine kinase PhoR